jgi:hypothetical protein
VSETLTVLPALLVTERVAVVADVPPDPFPFNNDVPDVAGQ